MSFQVNSRTRAGNLRKINPRLAGNLARTLLTAEKSPADVEAFAAYTAAKGFEFTETWADNNIPYASPLLRRFAEDRKTIRYLEIGAYEGKNLAYMDWLLPGKLDTTVIDPWFDESLNPEEKYLAVEPRFQRNVARMSSGKLRTIKGFSTYELPRMLAAEERFDLIYVDGSHTAWAVMIDLAYCAAMLEIGGVMLLDDYWHDVSETGGPGVKQAVDRFHGMLGDYFAVEAVYRQVALKKIREIPR